MQWLPHYVYRWEVETPRGKRSGYEDDSVAARKSAEQALAELGDGTQRNLSTSRCLQWFGCHLPFG